MKKILVFFYFFAILLLFIDSFRAYDSSLRYIGVDSTLIGFTFLTIILITAFTGKYPLGARTIKFNKLVFIISFSASIILILLNFFITPEHRNLSYMWFYIQAESLVYLPFFTGGVAYIYQRKNLNFPNRVLYLGAPVLLFLLLMVDIYNHKLFVSITSEDSLFENIQFTLFLFSSIFSLLTTFTYFSKKKRFVGSLFFLIFLFLAFIAFEEISWGERVLNFEAPVTFIEGNRQGEFNIHNQGFFQAHVYLLYMIVGIWGALGYKIINYFPFTKIKDLNPVFPDGKYTFYFFSVTVYYFLSHFMGMYLQPITLEKTGVGLWQEVSELFLAIGFLLFTHKAFSREK